MVAVCSAVACLAVLAAAPAALGAEYQIAASENSATFFPKELTVAPGDRVTRAFYWAPGHAPEALEDSEYVDFSPSDEFNHVIEHIKAQA